MIGHERKGNFYGIFREKFAEKSADFAEQLQEFSKQTSLKKGWYKNTDFVGIFRTNFAGNGLVLHFSVSNVFLTEIIISLFNNNMLQK